MELKKKFITVNAEIVERLINSIDGGKILQ